MTTLEEPTVPLADGYHLPTAAYTDQDWFERERRELFDHTWQFVGMLDDFARDGDFRTSDIGSSQLVVIRSEGTTLRAFHNVCRHRGARLFEGNGNAGREVRCFYHSWAYGFDGALKRIPQRDQFPELDMACLGLHRASVDSWNGLVFVHPDPDAQPLAEWLGEFPDAMGPYRPLELTEVSRDTFEVRANWKLFAENHIDGYHLWHLHSKSVVGFEHTAQAWQPIGRHWSFSEPAQQPGASPTANDGLPPIPGLAPKWLGSNVHLLFPNLGIATGGEYWLTLQMIPLAPDRTRVEVRTRTMPLSTAAKARFVAQEVAEKGLAILGRRPAVGQNQITDEDTRAAEAIQRAMQSPKFSVGPMARDYEGAISEFQRNILDYLKPIR
jgi:phenylpropionate dioxygenase-like ring-hydroxylating dioxygenase large terminal subunit